MKKKILKNRFPQEVFAEWIDWHSCHICGQNTWDCLHHIISPTNDCYIKGDHNRSIYNSAPLCNNKCHLYNPDLPRKWKTIELLKKTKEAMEKMGYEKNERDKKFLEIYKDLYE